MTCPPISIDVTVSKSSMSVSVAERSVEPGLYGRFKILSEPTTNLPEASICLVIDDT